MRKVTIPVTFEVGTLKELSYGGLKQSWISGESNGIRFTLTCGAGLGNPLMEASANPTEGVGVYARTDISDLASKLWTDMREDLDE